MSCMLQFKITLNILTTVNCRDLLQTAIVCEEIADVILDVIFIPYANNNIVNNWPTSFAYS